MTDPGNTAASTADLASNAKAGMDNPQVTANATAAATASPVVAQQAHHSVLGKMYDTFLDALGGKNDVSYKQDDSGKLIPVTTPRSHGEQWDHILAGAFTGLAASGKMNGPARNNPIATFATGAAAGQAKVEDNDASAKTAAENDVKRQRDTRMFNAQMAKLDQDLTSGAFELSRRKVQAGADMAKDHKAFMDTVLNGDPGNIYLGTASSVEELMQKHSEIPGLLKAHTNAQIVTLPHVNDKGVYDGAEYAMVTPEWGERMITSATPLTHWVPDAKGGLKAETVMLQPGTYRNKDVVAFKKSEDDVRLKWDMEQSKEKNALDKERIHEAGEMARHAGDKGERADQQLQAKGTDYLTKGAQDYQKFIGSANTIKQSIGAAKDGNELAAAVEPLQGTLFIMAEGGVKRINRQELEGVRGAGSLVQNIEGYLSKAGKGDPIPNKLKDDMSKLIDLYQQSRYQQYRNNTEYTMRLHKLDPRVTPILGPDGKMIDPASGAASSPATQTTGWGSAYGGVQRPQH